MQLLQQYVNTLQNCVKFYDGSTQALLDLEDTNLLEHWFEFLTKYQITPQQLLEILKVGRLKFGWKFFPKVEDVIKQIFPGVFDLSEETICQQAAKQILKAALDCGYNNPHLAERAMEPLNWKILNCFGGWNILVERLHDNEDISFIIRDLAYSARFVISKLSREDVIFQLRNVDEKSKPASDLYLEAQRETLALPASSPVPGKPKQTTSKLSDMIKELKINIR